ncbi:MAG: hypothetical protein AB7T49_10345 [Oligoflexales bacterium]
MMTFAKTMLTLGAVSTLAASPVYANKRFEQNEDTCKEVKQRLLEGQADLSIDIVAVSKDKKKAFAVGKEFVRDEETGNLMVNHMVWVVKGTELDIIAKFELSDFQDFNSAEYTSHSIGLDRKQRKMIVQVSDNSESGQFRTYSINVKTLKMKEIEGEQELIDLPDDDCETTGSTITPDKAQGEEEKGEKGQTEQGQAQQSQGEQSQSEQGQAQQSQGEQGQAQQSQGEQSQSEQGQAQQSQGEQSQGEQSQGEQGQAQQSQGEQSQGEQSQGEQSQGEQSQGEQSQGEQSQGEQL